MLCHRIRKRYAKNVFVQVKIKKMNVEKNCRFFIQNAHIISGGVNLHLHVGLQNTPYLCYPRCRGKDRSRKWRRKSREILPLSQRRLGTIRTL